MDQCQGSNSDVLALSRAFFSELMNYSTTQVDFYICTMVAKEHDDVDDVIQDSQLVQCCKKRTNQH